MNGTRERILASTTSLMQTHGYAATSVDMICQATGVTKGAFFHHFESKESVAVAALEVFAREFAESIAAAPFMAETDPLAKLWGYLEHAKGMATDPKIAKGCLVAMFTLERSYHHKPFRDICAGALGGWTNMVASLIRDVTAAYPPRAAMPAEELAREFVGLVEGSLIQFKAFGDPMILANNIDHFRRYLNLLLGEPAVVHRTAANA